MTLQSGLEALTESTAIHDTDSESDPPIRRDQSFYFIDVVFLVGRSIA